MAEGFYQQSNTVLKFEIKDINEIVFNHYISKKENLQRTKGILPRGQFCMTIGTVGLDLNLTFGVARGLIKKFVDLEIITNIFTPRRGNKTPSIWQYNSVCANNDVNNDIDNDINNDVNIEEPIEINGLSIVANNDINNDDNNDVDNDINNSKKENLKRKLKNKKIYSALNSNLEKQVEEIWRLYPNKKGKEMAYKKIPKLIKEYGFDEIKKSVERYSKECVRKEKKYIKHGNNFFYNGFLDYLDINFNEVGQVQNNWSEMKQFN